MGKTLKPIPAWSDAIEVAEVTEASALKDFKIRRLSDLGRRLNFASLEKCLKTGELTLTMRDRTFITFRRR